MQLTQARRTVGRRLDGMDWRMAETLAEASAIAYDREPGPTTRFPGHGFHRFRTRSFTGFVAALDDAVVVAFRGTHLRARPSLMGVVKLLRQLVANVDFAQVPDGGARVHEGFCAELAEVWPRLLRALDRHGGRFKQVYVTGHSAGGAMATLAAHSLHLEGYSVRAAYAYSAPRVGDFDFAAHYAVPLYRFENRDDFIPHLPHATAVEDDFQRLLTPLLKVLGCFVPQARRLQPSLGHYAHAGEVFYFDDDGDVRYSPCLALPAGTIDLGFGGGARGPRLWSVEGNEMVRKRIKALTRRMVRAPSHTLQSAIEQHGIESVIRAIRRFRRGIRPGCVSEWPRRPEAERGQARRGAPTTQRVRYEVLCGGESRRKVRSRSRPKPGDISEHNLSA